MGRGWEWEGAQYVLHLDGWGGQGEDGREVTLVTAQRHRRETKEAVWGVGREGAGSCLQREEEGKEGERALGSVFERGEPGKSGGLLHQQWSVTREVTDNRETLKD